MFQIRHRNGMVLFEGDHIDLKTALVEAVKAGADLTGANLRGANLYGAGKIASLRVFTGLYNYQCWAVVTEAGAPWIRMGCLFKSLADWDAIGIRSSNPSEFPDNGSEKSERRVRAFAFTRDAVERMVAEWAAKAAEGEAV